MIKQLEKHFDDTKTTHNMKSPAVLLGFCEWIDDQPIPNIEESIPTSSLALRMVYKEQIKIGWDQLIRGRLSKRWADSLTTCRHKKRMKDTKLLPHRGDETG